MFWNPLRVIRCRATYGADRLLKSVLFSGLGQGGALAERLLSEVSI